MCASWTFFVLGPSARAADPRTLPLFDPTQVYVAGKFTVPGVDQNGALINYGGSAVGVSEDGQYLYANCRQLADGTSARGYFVKLRIPALGGTATIVHPCQGLPNSELAEITGNPGDYFPTLGGVMEKGGRMITNGYVTYDAAGVNAPRRTFWSGSSITALNGPFEGSVRNGLVKGSLGHIPVDWQPLLGGDSFAIAGYTSIISRASYGPSFTTFNAASITGDGFQMKFLLGCPYYEPGTTNYLNQCISRYGSPQSLIYYNGSEQTGGAYIVPGTRTFYVVEREALGPTCYGYATRNQADHGLPYLDAVYCYSLVDPLNEKGPKGYPYQLVAKLFDLKDLVDVKDGKKLPWNVDPYNVVYMPGSGPGEMIGYTGGGTFNHVTGQYYLTRELYPNGSGGAEVTVYGGFTASGGGGTPSACDLDGTGTTQVNDVQLCANQATGITSCTNGDIDLNSSCNVVDVQRVVNAALGGACVSP